MSPESSTLQSNMRVFLWRFWNVILGDSIGRSTVGTRAGEAAPKTYSLKPVSHFIVHLLFAIKYLLKTVTFRCLPAFPIKYLLKTVTFHCPPGFSHQVSVKSATFHCPPAFFHQVFVKNCHISLSTCFSHQVFVKNCHISLCTCFFPSSIC